MASRATSLGTAWRAARTCQAREVDRRCVDAVDIVVVAAAASVAVVEVFVAGAEAANTPAAALVAVCSLLLFANYLSHYVFIVLVSAPGACYFCGQEGHQQRNCPERQVSGGGAPEGGALGGGPPGGRVVTCYNCGQEGHYSRECPEPRRERVINGEDGGRGAFRGRGRGGGPRGQRCYNCNQFGHIARECPTGDKGPTCYRFAFMNHLFIQIEYLFIQVE